MNTTTISLDIEQIVFEGMHLSAKDQAVLADALQQELQHLLAQKQAQEWTGRHEYRIQAPPLQLRADSGPQQIGRQLALALYSGLTE